MYDEDAAVGALQVIYNILILYIEFVSQCQLITFLGRFAGRRIWVGVCLGWVGWPGGFKPRSGAERALARSAGSASIYILKNKDVRLALKDV